MSLLDTEGHASNPTSADSQSRETYHHRPLKHYPLSPMHYVRMCLTNIHFFVRHVIRITTVATVHLLPSQAGLLERVLIYLIRCTFESRMVKRFFFYPGSLSVSAVHMSRSALLLLLPLLAVSGVHAANDWAKPCFEGECFYDLPQSVQSGSMRIVSGIF